MIRTGVVSVSAGIAVWIALATSAAFSQPSGVPHTAELTDARVDPLDTGETVVSMMASGDLKGVVTFKLRRTAEGGVSGEWAFTVAHVDNTDPATGREPEAEHHHEHGDGHGERAHPHRDYVTMVHRGALAGTVTGAELTFDSAGALATMSASLTIAQGSSEFAGATGSGQATLTALNLFF
jgi:hypothetical protein